MSGILRIIYETDMRNGPDGLVQIAKREKISIEDLKPGELVVFINSKLNKIKIYSQSMVNKKKLPVISYVWEKNRIDLNTIQYIPKAYSEKGLIDMDAALKKSIIERLDRKRSKAA